MESEETSSSPQRANDNGEKRRGSSKTENDDGPQASKRERRNDEGPGNSSGAEGAGDSFKNGNCSKDKDGPSEGQSSNSSFPRLTRRYSRNYRRANDNADESSSSDDEMAPRSERAGIVSPRRESSNRGDNAVREDEDGESDSSAAVHAFGSAFMAAFRHPGGVDANGRYISDGNASEDSDELSEAPSFDSDSDTDVILDFGGASEYENEEPPELSSIPCLNKEKPRHTWSVTKEVMSRQYGVRSSLLAPQRFTQKFAGSLHCVQRLELMSKLKNHSGCVNTVQFNDTGDKLISGSDDKRVVVWNWSTAQTLVEYQSGHTSNIIQARFLHDCNDTHIVSCARDGQVRLAVLSSTGECRFTHRLAQHRRGAHKLATHPEIPRNVLSVGEDALVMSIDTRIKKAEMIVTVMESGNKVGLYSIHSHPMNYHEFCVSGVDRYIRIYDKRRIPANFNPMKKLCPSNLKGRSSFYNVTCAVYNHDGTELIGSYNDEDVYLFRTDDGDADHPDHVYHKYEGHRNSATVKSVNFFGPNSEFVISGSDCGNIFFWEKKTESIVQFMRGDEMGVVNALVMHPQLPILATSGYDSDVKVWVPSCEVAPDLTDRCIRKVVTRNISSKSYTHRNVFQRLDLGRSIRMPVAGAEVFLEALRRGAVQPFVSSTDSSDDSASENPSHCPPS